ncbi:hypothetical protein J3A83DRAFT_2165678 [Scleroderma citrinum]
MAPRTRSASGTAPTTPSKPRVSIGSSGLPTPNSPPRRTPHCTKCGRPRAGHPRSGCPYVAQSAPPSPSATKSIVATTPTSATDDSIAEELSSLCIVNPAEDRELGSDPTERSKRRLSVRFALVPGETLASLCTTDSELVERLLAPGMMSDTCADEDHDTVLRWRKTLLDADPLHPQSSECIVTAVNEPKPSIQVTGPALSRQMPCTLHTPTASLTSTQPLSDNNIGGSINMNNTIFLVPDPDVKQPKLLQRSMSVEQRSLLLERLTHSKNAPATLISISEGEVECVRKDAEQVGFIVRVLSGGGEDGRRWVILGTDAQAMDLLERRFSEEDRKRAKAQNGGKLRAAAGGALLGAVATWTGLAFS